MMQLCLRYTKNEHDAVEVLNNGFLKVFRSINRYEFEKGSLYTWIRTIVIHACIDFVKQKTDIIHHELADAVEIKINSGVIEKIDALKLLVYIRQLTPALQTVFNLYVMEGYKHREIAQLLHISEGTSKWHLSEARKKLQQMILLQEVQL